MHLQYVMLTYKPTSQVRVGMWVPQGETPTHTHDIA